MSKKPKTIGTLKPFNPAVFAMSLKVGDVFCLGDIGAGGEFIPSDHRFHQYTVTAITEQHLIGVSGASDVKIRKDLGKEKSGYYSSCIIGPWSDKLAELKLKKEEEALLRDSLCNWWNRLSLDAKQDIKDICIQTAEKIPPSDTKDALKSRFCL